METNIQKFKCGECGEDKHIIYSRDNGDIIVECIKCKSQSEIVILPPMWQIRNLAGAGTLCIF